MTGNPYGLDADVLAFIAKSESFYPASANAVSPTENRAIYDRMCAAFDHPRPEGVTVTEHALAAPGRILTVRFYTPAAAVAGRLALYLHGGGFVVGGLHSHDGVCAELAEASGITVGALDYRLAPEHVYPAALDDAEAAYLHIGGCFPRLVLVGDSAGGNLAAALCMRLRRKAARMPRGQVLIYPGLHPQAGHAIGSWRENAPMLRATDSLVYRHLYVGHGDASTTDDPELAPLAARSFAGLPPAAIFAADVDPLAEDSALYAEALSAAGVPVTFDPGLGLVHGHLRGRHMAPRIASTFSAIAEAIARLA
jgi:acetyl esterase